MKHVAVLFVFSLIALGLTATTPVLGRAGDTSTISEFCTNHGDLGLSHGGCVAYFVTRNVVPHDASVCKDENIRKLLGATNRGQCVKKLGELRK